LPTDLPARQSSPGEIRAFTGLRGVAALYVVLYHYGLHDMVSGPLSTVLGHGYMAVDLFFMMSGFVMALTYRHLFAEGPTGRGTLLFLGKRIARIYPLYFLASLAALIVLGREGAVQPSGTQFFSNLFMMQAWGIAGSYDGPGWSISTEWAAYLIFPLLCSAGLFGRKAVALISAALAFGLLLLLAELPAEVTHVVRARGPLDFYDGQNYGPVVRCVIEFGLGMVCFRAARNGRVAGMMGRNWVSLALIATTLILLAIPGSDIWVIPPTALLLISLAGDKNAVARTLGQPTFHWLGTISYSIYLFHTTVAAAIGPELHAAVTASGVRDGHAIEVTCLVAAVLAIATLTYRLIEKPGRRWLQGIFSLGRGARGGNANLAAP
jgi:peptidoglycan/LPS O-acetylase OafA/YrhL